MSCRRLPNSISAHGVLQPVVVVEDGYGFILIAGERRLRAVRQLGLHTIPAVIRTANEIERLELAFVENLQRSDLNALEEARAYRHLIDDFGLTQERVAERVGRSRPAVANSAAHPRDLGPGAGRRSRTAPSAGATPRPWRDWTTTDSRMSCSQAWWRDRCLSGRRRALWPPLATKRRLRPTKAQAREVDPDIQHMEAQMREALGTKVTIASGRRGGRITITWYDDEDLGRLVDRLAMVDR